MALSRGEIVQAGVELAGRSDLLRKGALWLNLFLEDQYEDYDWPWLLKTQTLSVSDGVSLPDDYRRAKSATIIDNESPFSLRTVEKDEFENERNNNQLYSRPTLIYIDKLNNAAYFYPTPVSSYTMRLDYYHSPELLDSGVNDDASEPVWGESDNILVQAVYVRALQYLDDSRHQQEDMRLEAMLGKSKMNTQDTRAGRSRVPLGKSFRRRFR